VIAPFLKNISTHPKHGLWLSVRFQVIFCTSILDAMFGVSLFLCPGSNGFVARLRRWVFYNVGHAIVRFCPASNTNLFMRRAFCH